MAAIHFLTDEMWTKLSSTIIDIANQCLDEHEDHQVAIELSKVILQAIKQGEHCQILYGLACIQVQYLAQGDTGSYQIATSAHDQVKAVMIQYEQHCHECNAINETVFDEHYKVWMCKNCQLKLHEQ